MWRRVVPAAAIGVLAVAALIVQAGASSGSFTDPNDTSSPLDMKTITHADTASTITYTVEMHDSWDPATITGTPPYEIDWFLDLPGSNEVEGEDVCVTITGAELDYEVTGCGSDPTVFDSGTATKSGNTVSVTWDRGAITEAGFGTPTAYNYRVFTVTPNPGGGTAIDFAPDSGDTDYVHTFDPPSSTTSIDDHITSSTAPTTTTTVVSRTTTTTAAGTQSAGTASDTTVTPGQQIIVNGSGFAPSSPARRKFKSQEVDLGLITTDASGSYRTTFTIPASATPGPHSVVVEGVNPAGGRHESITAVTVLAGQTLPTTGSNPRHPVSAGLVAIGVGLLLVATAWAIRLRSLRDWPTG